MRKNSEISSTISPIDLFIELKKYVSAKKAGNNNVDDKILFILQNVLQNKFINNEYFSKIKSKYF